MTKNASNREQEHRTIYAFAHVEGWIENYAKINQIPCDELTARVGELLLSAAGGQVRGTKDRMSALPGESTARGEAVAAVAVDDGACSRASGRGKARKLKSLHWTQRPENKAKMQKTLRAMKKARKKAGLK